MDFWESLSDQMPRKLDYDALCERFSWDLPAHYNMGVDVCDRHAGDRGKLPGLKSLTSRQAALRKAAQGYGKYERTVLAKRKKRFDRALQKLARDAKR